MKNIILFLLFVTSFSLLNAQGISSKYLKDAVPFIDGKVVFSKEITTGVSVPAYTLFDLMDKWAKENYPQSDDIKNRILISNPDSKQIGILGGKDLIFKNQALVLDRAFMSYQLLFEIEDSKCLITIKNIKYEYSDVRDKEILPAETMIIDEIALNKDGSKLHRYYDKFRTHTIDSVNIIFEDIDVYLNGEKQKEQGLKEGAVKQQTQTVTASVVPSELKTSSTLAGYKHFDADKIPDDIKEQMMGKALLINNGRYKTVTSGGIDSFDDKTVMFVTTDDKISEDVYIVAFYPESSEVLVLCDIKDGLSRAQMKENGFDVIETSGSLNPVEGATIVVECKKGPSQPIASSQNLRMNIGQILNIWSK